MCRDAVRNDNSGLMTAAEIALEARVPLHRVQYVLRSNRSVIKPLLTAAQTRLFAPAAVAAVKAMLRAMDRRRLSPSASTASDPQAHERCARR